MSIGLQYLNSIITNGARTELLDLNPAVMVDEAERRAYDFVMQFTRNYDALPTVDTCARHGHSLPDAIYEAEYYRARLADRFKHGAYAEAMRTAQAAYQQRNMGGVDDALRSYFDVTSRVVRDDDTQTLHSLMQEVYDDYQEAHLRTARRGVTLGWDYLDQLTGGGEGGDVVTVVARPNKGKSWLITHMAHRAWRANHSVLLLTMEMTGKQMARRTMGLDMGVNPNYIREGRLSTHSEGTMRQTIENVRTGAPFHIIQGSFSKSLDAVEKAIHQYNPDAIYIDASYLMQPSKRSGGPKKNHEILAAVGTEMKELAISANRPFVQTVQFNRSAEQAEERTLAHIGGTDVVGQISTVVIGVDDGPMPYPENTRAMDVLKNRENPLGRFVTNFMFNPPNFNYRPPEDTDPADNGGVEAEWSL